MESSNEVNQITDDHTRIDSWKIHKLDESLYDVKEFIDDEHGTDKSAVNNGDSSPWNLIADSGDIINYSDKNLQDDRLTTVKNDYFDDELIEPRATPEESIPINEQQHFDNEEKEQSTITIKSHHHLKTKYSFVTEHPLTHVDSQHAILMEQELSIMTKHDEYSQSTEIQITDDKIILPEKADLKDLNPYEPEQSSRKKSQEEIPSHNTFCLFNIEHYPTTTYSICPQFGQNQIKSFDSFQQLWSSQVYSTQLDTSEDTLSILWSLVILLSKLIITGFNLIYSCTKILRYDTLLFGFSYWLGILFGTNAYFYIDFLLIGICIISIFVATYEKWLFHYVDLNEYENIDSERQYWRRVKLAAYGLAIGTITTYII